MVHLSLEQSCFKCLVAKVARSYLCDSVDMASVLVTPTCDPLLSNQPPFSRLYHCSALCPDPGFLSLKRSATSLLFWTPPSIRLDPYLLWKAFPRALDWLMPFRGRSNRAADQGRTEGQPFLV